MNIADISSLSLKSRRSSTDGFVHVDLDSNVTSVRSLDNVREPGKGWLDHSQVETCLTKQKVTMTEALVLNMKEAQ